MQRQKSPSTSGACWANSGTPVVKRARPSSKRQEAAAASRDGLPAIFAKPLSFDEEEEEAAEEGANGGNEQQDEGGARDGGGAGKGGENGGTNNNNNNGKGIFIPFLFPNKCKDNKKRCKM
jgi:hypothetical protein